VVAQERKGVRHFHGALTRCAGATWAILDGCITSYTELRGVASKAVLSLPVKGLLRYGNSVAYGNIGVHKKKRKIVLDDLINGYARASFNY
jgi:hypothetical protein